MNKKIIIFSVLAVLLLAMVVFSFSVRANKKNKILDNVQYSLSCAKEGEQVRTSGAGLPTNCCSGLKSMYGYARADCKAPGLPGDIGTCSKCGNGSCDVQNNENKCNCPEDCK